MYYRPPGDPAREERLMKVVSAAGGRLDFREAPEVDGSVSVCLTYEFDDFATAKKVSDRIRTLGEYVEGPSQYT